MVRTKADSCPAAGRKVVAARAPRKCVGASSSGSGSSDGASPSSNKYAGGNPVCVRPTPDWQKGISSFFSKKPGKDNQEPGEGHCSGSSSKATTSQSQAGSSGCSTSASCPSASGNSSNAEGSLASTDNGADEDEDNS